MNKIEDDLSHEGQTPVLDYNQRGERYKALIKTQARLLHHEPP